MPKYSIIIPTLNEQEFLSRVLNSLNDYDENFEIIVADGGSEDATMNIARNFGAQMCSAKRGKGFQLIKGVECSSGELLIFLHADTFLPENAFRLIDEYITDGGNKIATFRMKFDSNSILLKFYSWFTKFDSVLSTFGDQVIVVNKDFYKEIGGFSKLSIFEDVELFRKARKKTRITKLPAYVITSARRYKKNGIVFTQVLNGIYLLRYFMGVKADRIYDKYFR